VPHIALIGDLAADHGRHANISFPLIRTDEARRGPQCEGLGHDTARERRRPSEEQIMPKQTLKAALWLALIVAAVPSALAQPQASGAPVRNGIECGGQYECVDSRPMSETEVLACRCNPLDVEPRTATTTIATTVHVDRPAPNGIAD
jgi:hypothetical protein